MDKLQNYRNYSIKQTSDLAALDDTLKESLLDLQESMHAVSKRENVLRSRDYRKKRLNQPQQANHKRTYFLALDNDKIVAIGSSWYREFKEDPNPDKLEVEVEVHPDYRQQGIGTHLASLLSGHAEKIRRTKYEAWIAPVDGPEGAIFTSKMGLTKVMEEKTSRLYREEIKWDYIRQQEDKHRQSLNTYRFECLNRESWATRILEEKEFADEMADFLTEVVNLIPKEDIRDNDFLETADNLRESAKQILRTPTSNSLNYYAFDGDCIIAMSGNFYPEDPPVRDVGTGLTAVRKAYQRQGLASLLKIMVIRAYLDKFPEFEYIETENAASNAAMLAINYGLGFKTMYSWEMWQKLESDS